MAMPAKNTQKYREMQINNSGTAKFLKWDCGEYVNLNCSVTVSCLLHNEVWSVTARTAINGAKCRICQREYKYKLGVLPSTHERFNQLNDVEGIFIIERGVDIENLSRKIKVKCTKCSFEWAPSVHSLIHAGSGCPSCAERGYNPRKKGSLYALRSECGKYIKIGISNDPKRRHKELERRTQFKFNLVERISGDGAKIAELEKYFHNKYERAGFTGFDGATEWLICTPELLQELRNLGDK